MATVTIPQGILRGRIYQTSTGVEYYQFFGVPFAKPPLGDLRFKSPQSPEPWKDIRDATRYDKSMVPSQVSLTTYAAIGSEDCLYLNVHTPRLPKDHSHLLPVFVTIHGGGFQFENGIELSRNDPEYLIDFDVVVVTINYRLGVFGFLSLDIPEAAGNMGMKDQVKALEWVRNNIHTFGGDKNNVTVVGYSAGAGAVELLVLSPMAKGLFHRAILQSGSAINYWAINDNSVELAKALVKKLDYKGSLENNKAMLEYLLTEPMINIMSAAVELFMRDYYDLSKVCLSFAPTIERDFGNGDAFLTESPYKLMKEGKFNKMPIIKGFVSKEGALTCATKPEALKTLIELKNFGDYLDVDTVDMDAFISKFSSVYLDNAKSAADIVDAAEDFLGDLDFVSGVWVSGTILSSQVPVYMYRFTYIGKPNSYRRAFNLVDKKIALHTDDWRYVLKGGYEKYDSTDILVRKKLLTLFTNFAKFGEPTPNTCDLIPLNWPKFSKEAPVYLEINTDLSLHTDYEPKKMALYEELYEKRYKNYVQRSSPVVVRSNL